MSHYLRSLVFLNIFLLVSCSEPPPKTIKVGFIACLSGESCDLGHGGRDGVILAIEEINKSGGILSSDKHKYKLELITIDLALKESRESVIKNNGIQLLIGPMLSQKAVELINEVNRQKITMISPTVSSHKLAGKDDYFFRVYPTCDITSLALANYARSVEGAENIAIIFDPQNSAFAKTWSQHFTESFEKVGGKIVSVRPIDETASKKELVERSIDDGADGILCILNSKDTAIILQQAHLKKDINLKIYGTEWSTTESLERFAGESLEGAVFITSFDEGNKSKTFLNYEKMYRDRFNEKSSFSSRFGYESVQLLKAALQINADTTQINKTLKNIQKIKSLQGDIHLDQYGDIHRAVYIEKYIDGRFRIVHRVPAP